MHYAYDYLIITNHPKIILILSLGLYFKYKNEGTPKLVSNKFAMITISTNFEQDKNDFFLFLEEFGPIACSYKNFSRYCRQNYRFQDCCTPSDEALVLFFIKINWENWVSNSTRVKFKSNRKLNGWSTSELEEFNSICKNVFRARQDTKRKKT